MEFHDLDVGADEELLPAQGGAKDTEERRRGVGSMSIVPQLLFSGLTISEVFQTLSRSMCMSSAVCTVRGVLMHLDETFDVHVKWHFVDRWLCVCVLVFPLGVGRQALHTPSTAASSTTAASNFGGRGIGTFGPLPHTFGEYFIFWAVYIGGSIGTFGLPPQILEGFRWARLCSAPS